MTDSPSNDTIRLENAPQVVGGRWQIIEPLADGGMGKVYIAKHHRTGRKAALKILERDDPESQARFRLEASVAAEINHPGVVDVYDADVDQGTGHCYIAMELLEGRTLREAMDDTDETPTSLLDLIMLALAPLAAAHDKGYVHRDLKPENIFVVARSKNAQIKGARVKLLDFGIAGHELKKGLTQTGTAMGTPHYMSPEQAMNAAQAEPSADVWSMGVLLYEAISGHVPFSGETAHAVVVHACTEDPPRLGTIAPDVAPALEALIMQCLTKAPGDRPKNATELQQQLILLSTLPDSIPAQRTPGGALGNNTAEFTSSIRQKEGDEETLTTFRVPSMGLANIPWHLLGSLAGPFFALGSIFSWKIDLISAPVAFLLCVTGSSLTIAGIAAIPRSRRKSVLELPRRMSSTPSQLTAEPQDATPLVQGPASAGVHIELITNLGATSARRVCERIVRLQHLHRDDLIFTLQALPADGGDKEFALAEIIEEIRHQKDDPTAWTFVEGLVALRKRLTPELVLDHVRGLGLHMTSLHHALRAHVHGEKLTFRMARCQQRGLCDDPVVLLQGQRLAGELSTAYLARAVEDALRNTRKAAGHGQTQVALPQGTPSHMELRQILVCFNSARDAPKSVRRTREQAKQRAEKLRARACLPGTDFADIAMRFGDAEMDLGHVELFALKEELMEGVATLNVGDVSRPVEASDGFHVVQRIG